MESKQLMSAIREEVNRLGLTDQEVNAMAKTRYGKSWFFACTTEEQIDFLNHLKEESNEF